MMLPCYKIFYLDKVNPIGRGERDGGKVVREGVESEGDRWGRSGETKEHWRRWL